MKILNIMWGFNLGGIGKCFLTYASLGNIEPRLSITTACISLKNVQFGLEPLKEIGATLINIRNRGDIAWLEQCRKLILSVKPDVIFTHGFNGPVVVKALNWRYGLNIPMICSYHGEYHPPCFSRRFVAPVINRAVHAIYRKDAAGVVTVAEANREFLVRCGVDNTKVTVVHNGIAWRLHNRRKLTTFTPKIMLEPGEIVMGIASRLDPIKGLEYLIDAVAMVRRSGVRIRLILIGDGPLKSTLMRRSYERQIEKYVYFAGFQTNVAEWLETMDIFALPSLSEAHSISLLEAMRAGTAIVASDVGGNPESVRNEREALLVPPANASALACALSRLANDSILRTRLGNAARERYEAEFTETVMKRRLVDWLLRFDSKKDATV